jgi:hypothetical protein
VLRGTRALFCCLGTRLGRTRLQQIAHGRGGGDAGSGEGTGEADGDIALGVVGSEGKGSGEVVSVWRYSDALSEARGADGIADAVVGVIRELIGVPGKVVEVELRLSGLLPDAQAEIAVLGRANGVHDFGVVAVPDGEGVVDDGVGDGAAVHGLSDEEHVPHADDGLVALESVVDGAYARNGALDSWMKGGWLDQLAGHAALGESGGDGYDCEHQC